MPSYTPDQRAAIETHDRNVVVVAGAGSGKTRVLVERFVALLAAHPDWPLPSLVAITFTDKAAAELRDRVRLAIETRIAAADTPDQRRMWQTHQAAFDGARIGTIHGLCRILLHANAAHLNLDPGFDVLDGAEAAILRAAAVEDALIAIAQTPAARLFGVYGTAPVRDALRAALADGLDLTPDFYAVGDPLARWTALYAEVAAVQLADPELIALLNWQPSVMPSGADKLLDLWLSVHAIALAWPKLATAQAFEGLRACAAVKLTVGSAKAWGGKAGLDAAKDALRALREKAVETLTTLSPLSDADTRAADLIPPWQDAIRAARTAYTAAKTQAGALDFNDLETLTRQLLQDESVRARYRAAEFRHILVDEFQDTNAVQRDIVYALSGLDQPGSLFVVGDPKQAIYGFRGADVRVFEQVRAEITAAGGLEITLNTSFRAHQALIDGLNAVFAQLLVKSSEYAVAFGAPLLGTRASEAQHRPAFDVIALDKAYAADTEKRADDLRRWEAITLAERLKALIEGGWPVWDKDAHAYRPATYGDCTVLFRATSAMPHVEAVFKAARLPYVTLAGKGYYDRPEVWDVLNLLRALYNSADDLALASALRSPLFSVSDDGLYGLRLSAPLDVSLWAALVALPAAPSVPDGERLAYARSVLIGLQALAGRLTLAELLARALDETAFLATLSGLPDGGRRVNNVEKLRDMARRSGRLALGDFLTFIDNAADTEAREGEAPTETSGAIQLMTVHASKGLEFPIVALFDTTARGRYETPTLAFDPRSGLTCTLPTNAERADPVSANGDESNYPQNYERSGDTPPLFAYRYARQRADQRQNVEQLRLFYVGATRAQDRLIVSGQRTANPETWLARLIGALDLPADPGAETQTVERAPGFSVAYTVPRTPPPPEHTQFREATAWERLDSLADAAPHVPALLAAPPADPYAPARTLSATELAMLGEAHALRQTRPASIQQFRERILHDAPTSIRDVADLPTAPRTSKRIIGEMVHQALQWQHVPGDVTAWLRSYAWRLGVTDAAHTDAAVTEALDLLQQTEQTPIIQKMRAATTIYREQPFTLRLGTRTISGQIDVLFRDKFGAWNILDYKTGDVEAEFVDAHARRYTLQIGLYAAAVEELTGQAPDTFIHYIRPVASVRIAESAWREALARLETDLLAALNDESRPGGAP